MIIALLLMTTTSSAGSYVANKQAEIVPAVPVVAEAGSVDVDLEVVKDGHLHRFVYRASGGEMVRYIVILKGGSESIRTNRVLARAMREAVVEAGLPEDAVQLIDHTDHEAARLTASDLMRAKFAERRAITNATIKLSASCAMFK